MMRLIILLTLVFFSCSDNSLIIEDVLEVNEGICEADEAFPNIPGWSYRVYEVPGYYNRGWKPYFIESDKGFLFGSDRYLLRTTNGGKNWEEAYTGSNVLAYQSMSFINNKTGYLSTHDKGAQPNKRPYQGTLLKTDDSGVSWNEINFKPEGILQQIFFINEHTGFGILGGQPRNSEGGSIPTYFVKTTDGGKNWTIVEGIKPANSVHNRLEFFHGGFGYQGGEDGIIYFTHDYGESWESITTPLDRITSLQFLNKNEGCAYTYKKMVRTTDGGRSWNLVSRLNVDFFHFFTADKGISLQAVYEEDHGDYINSCSAFLTTEDGCMTWKQGEAARAFNLGNVFFLNNKKGYSSIGFNPGYIVIMER